MAGTAEERMLAFVAECDDPDKLRQVLRNARERGAIALADAVFRKLVAVMPSEQPGTLEHDFWRSIVAFELVLSEERGRTTRLSRTRQKVAKVGIHQTLVDWAMDRRESQGFTMLLERNMPELTGEAVVLRHAAQFEEPVVAAARARLEVAGVDVSNILAAD